jgi:DNA-binding winged helix-turn-helix (wHTH) protein/Tol biopolymer transport system component
LIERGPTLAGPHRTGLKNSSTPSPFLLNLFIPLNSKDTIPDIPGRLQAFRVGEWLVHAQRNELSRDGVSTRVQPRLIQLLRQLALAGGRTVTREELLDAAWSRRMVNDEVLSRAIADLRQALGDDARQPRYLETIPKLGYRLIAAVEWLQQDLSEVPTAPIDAPIAEGAAPGPAAMPTSTGTPAKPSAARRRGWPGLWIAVILTGIAVGGLQLTRHAVPARIDWPGSLRNAQPLSSEPGWELAPRFAHRADLIVYSELDLQQDHARLRLRSRDGRVNRAFGDTDRNDLCPLFSPDDSELLWLRHDESGCQILRAPVLGGTPTAVATCASKVLSCPDWSGDWLVYTAEPAGPMLAAGLTRLRLRDGHAQVLTQPSRQDGDDTHPRFSADGRIAFSRGVEGSRSLRIWSPGAGDQAVPLEPSMLYGQIWLPDGRLMVASDGLGFRALLAVDTRSGQAELLGARGARYPDLASDGALVYETASYDANLWQFPADGSEPRQLTQSRRYDAYPRLAPGGKQLVYQSNRDGPESIYLQDLGDLSELRLPLDRSMRWAQPAWSVDGQRLLLTRYALGGVDLWQYVLGSHGPTPLASAPAGAHDAQFDPDGVHAWCRTGAERSGPLLRFALDGGEAASVWPEAVEHYQLSTSGLFIMRIGQPQLQHCPDASPASCIDLPIVLDEHQRRNWAVADGAVYFVAADAATSQKISRYRLQDGALSTLSWPRPGALSRAIDVESHGAFAIIARTDQVDIDLMWVSPPQPE